MPLPWPTALLNVNKLPDAPSWGLESGLLLNRHPATQLAMLQQAHLATPHFLAAELQRQ
jgi:hypothetical protein